MAIRDSSKKPYVVDRDNDRFVGIDYPLHKSSGKEGWFASTSTTIEAVKVNIRNLLKTGKGERLMQPTLGVNLRRFLFEQFTSETRIAVENEIVETFRTWLPFVQVRNIEIKMKDTDETVGRNTMSISILFNIRKDPNSLESVQVDIGEV